MKTPRRMEEPELEQQNLLLLKLALLAIIVTSSLRHSVITRSSISSSLLLWQGFLSTLCSVLDCSWLYLMISNYD